MKYLPKITKERYGATKESFIFSFKNKLSTENCILSRVNYDNRAISKWNHSGPSFGWKDLVVYGDEGLCIKDSYKEEIREIKEFFIEEYEINIEEVPAEV
ncbi:14020_t:CDS:2 [Funneliformis caledonium]|uniref:14020_t:CDS:1 n=1 Tax=Funneliformis caledonium TaxID=1117310 RepID=A0A9N9DL29_9GLOM|nr:14020_t:CDS:2 [Funneliformis caledonium]